MRMHGGIYSAAAITAIAASLVVMTGYLRSPARSSPAHSSVEVGETEYEVVSAYIGGIFTSPNLENRVGQGIVKLIIANTTQSGEDDLLREDNGQPIPWEKTAKSLQEKAPTLQQTTIDAFREVNVGQASLRPSFHIAINYALLDFDQLNSIPKGGDWWGEFYRRFPGSEGILTLSRVGFNAERTQALFYFSNRCGGLCGAGSYVVMEKRGSDWVISKEIEMWVS